MSKNASVRDWLWYCGFLVFCEITHPVRRPLKIFRKIWSAVWGARIIPDVEAVSQGSVPKKIWIYWAQGWESAPLLTKICRESWIKQNPGWAVISLSEATLGEYLSFDGVFDGKDIPHAAYSDIVRVSLLSRYGGVWADATTFCSAPLDDWLPQSMQSGFFAFYKQKTTIASWFLAAEKGNGLLREWEEYIARYWKFAKKPNRYFWVHYLFEYLIRNDSLARGVWDKVPRVSSDEPYAAQRCLKRGGDVDCVKNILASSTPVHKLDWKTMAPDIFLHTLDKRFKVPV